MYRQKMSTACTFGSIMKLQNDIEYWKTWEAIYSNTLSQNEGQRQKLESQKRLAAFMQEIKHEKLHLMREEIKKETMELENDIEYWKTWETNYSNTLSQNTLSQNERQRQKLESQKSLAAFMQEIKREKLHLMREEIKKLGSSN